MDDKQILNLLNGFSASGIAELDYEEAGVKLSLRRFACDRGFAPLPPPVHAVAAPPQAPSAQGADQIPAKPRSEAAKPHSGASGAETITSPLVATFYRSPGPDSPPFVESGKRVKAGQPLCILEAMKNMNELLAEYECEIVKVLPDNGSLVEYGQPLFEVRRV